MAKAKNGAKRRRSITVDMEGVESGSRSIPDGQYPAVITSVEERESSEGNPLLLVKWKTTGKKNAGVTLFDNISLLPQALWRLKGLLEAVGEEVPDSSMEVVLDDLVDKEAVVTITNETYEGKQRPKVTDYASIEDKSDDEEEEEEDDSDDDDDSGDSDESEDDEDDDSDDGDDEDGDDEDEDDEDEEEDSRPGRKPGKKTPAGKPSGKRPKFKVGQRVKFKDDEGKTQKGKITSLEDDVAKVETADEEEWEIEVSELTAL